MSFVTAVTTLGQTALSAVPLNVFIQSVDVLAMSEAKMYLYILFTQNLLFRRSSILKHNPEHEG